MRRTLMVGYTQSKRGLKRGKAKQRTPEEHAAWKAAKKAKGQEILSLGIAQRASDQLWAAYIEGPDGTRFFTRDGTKEDSQHLCDQLGDWIRRAYEGQTTSVPATLM
jgi:hypothetical protein